MKVADSKIFPQNVLTEHCCDSGARKLRALSSIDIFGLLADPEPACFVQANGSEKIKLLRNDDK